MRQLTNELVSSYAKYNSKLCQAIRAQFGPGYIPGGYHTELNSEVAMLTRGVVQMPSGGYDIPLASPEEQEAFQELAWRIIDAERAKLAAKCNTKLLRYIDWMEYTWRTHGMIQLKKQFLTETGTAVWTKAVELVGRQPKWSGGSAKGMYLKWHPKPEDTSRVQTDLLILCDWLKDNRLVTEAKVVVMANDHKQWKDGPTNPPTVTPGKDTYLKLVLVG